jgi:hypothetical protein
MRPGAEHRPNVTENGHTERSNLSKDLKKELSRRPGHKPYTGRMAQEANASRNGEDTLT